MNLTYGVILSRPVGSTRPEITLEHQGIGMFSDNRLLVGMQWGMPR